MVARNQRLAAVESRQVIERINSTGRLRRNPPRPRWGIYLLPCAALAALMPSPAAAQTWIAPLGSANWSNPGNWTPNVPVSSTATSITFGNSSSQRTANQDIAEPFDLNSLSITGGGNPYVINGGTLQFGANGTTAPRIEIANGSSGNTINCPVSFNASG